MLRVCQTCGVEKEPAQFYNDSRNQGRIKRHIHCRECSANKKNREYQKQYKLANRKAMSDLETTRFATRKEKAIAHMGGCCSKCGVSYPSCVYDFHHLDPSAKEMGPSRALSMSWENALKELNKCVLVCANCHRLIHFHREFPHEVSD